MDRQTVNIGLVIRAVARVCYTDALTVAWSSALTILASLPLLTLGPSLLALVDLWTDVILTESTGTVVNERARFRRFVDTWRSNVTAGLPYGVPPLVVGTGGILYFVIGVMSRSRIALLWTLISLYLVVFVLQWVLRAASIRMRSNPEQRPHFWKAMEMAAYSLTEEPAFSVLHLVWVGVVLALIQVFPPAFVLLGPGVIGVSETVAFEELFGDSAEAIRSEYAQR